MKIIFVAFRHDPLSLSNRQGADRHFLDALQANGCDCHMIGPFNEDIKPLEKVFRRFVRLLSNNAYMKHDLTNTCKAAQSLGQTLRIENADLVFSLYPASLAFYKGKTPCVLRTDATIKGVLKEAPQFLSVSPLLRWFALWIENRALHRSILVITHSEWSRNILEEEYGIDSNRIAVLPNPSSLPDKCLPESRNNIKEKIASDHPLRLLFVGQDPHRKGLDIALEVVDGLNQAGIETTLTICGLTGNSTQTVRYEGKLDLEKPDELGAYTGYLNEAHLLLHPALFDPAPRVTAEAAAFGTPTITNNTGGLGTSVLDSVSGIVLPKGSPPEAYVQTISDLVNDPARYQKLCQTTRERYEKELNWDVAGKRLVSILEKTVREHKNKQIEG
jgi:glycosyltransferase involved in cell wall biosynthesis